MKADWWDALLASRDLAKATRMSVVCHPYITRMYSVSSAWRSYVLVCYSYVTHLYSHVTCMSLLCTRMPLVCHSYVTRMSFWCHSYVPVCHLYVTRMYSYVICMSRVSGFIMNRCLWFYHEPFLKYDFRSNCPKTFWVEKWTTDLLFLINNIMWNGFS